jgi:transposase
VGLAISARYDAASLLRRSRLQVVGGVRSRPGSWQEWARQFRVSWGYSKKIRAQPWQTGRKERRQPAQHGRASRLTPLVEQRLRSALRRQPDWTLAELREPLQQSTGEDVSRSRLWVWLQRLGLRHKKNRSGHKNQTAAKTSGDGRRGGSR